ncbi:VirD4-like conjugal transfer protein, CD1115 family, partial [Hungatella hathewayi]|uniref:VirD4-like conjugal transfer protein, CD1115 family n=1 Tax=Hungatella hathewayi TaxID=154046 RepID=UPI003D80B596
MSYDELELDTLGDRKTALFLIMSDTDDTFNFVIAILQSQLFNLLCDKADDEYNGKLPIHVRFLLDEFANIGQIPRFDKLIATIRSREMSASIILQSQSQLKAIYKDAAEIILDNADSTLFLGGRGKNAKDISDNLGRETIDSFNTSENRGTQVSHGLTYQKLGKELMTQDEIAVMDGGKCILQLRGVRPFLSDKYDITKHPNYKYLSDFDNIHVHIVINSLRIYEVPLLPYMDRPADTREGCKHRCTNAAMEYFKSEVMEMCHREGLYQIDLLSGSKERITEREYWAAKKGQLALDKENAAREATGQPTKPTKFETDKAKLRRTIRQALSQAGSFDEFSSLLLREGVTVKESRGRLSYL